MKNEKGTIVLAGGVIGLIAAILVFFGNPANMGFCIACFLRDTTGALGLHSAAAVQYIRPEIIGLVLGACIISLAKKEFRPRGGSAPVTRFTLGAFVMIGCLMFLGCPFRMILRLAGGDGNALFGLVGFVAGILTGTVFLKKGYTLKRSYKMPKLEGSIYPAFQIVMLLLLVAAPAFIHFTEPEGGPGAKHAAIIIALAAGIITIICTIVYGNMTSSGISAAAEAYQFDPITLVMLIPVVITIYIAIKTGDIIIATSVGIVLGCLTACVCGLFDFIQIDVENAEVPAVIGVHGDAAALDRVVDGVIYTGISSMLQVCILALLLFGSISVMRAGEGDIMLLEKLEKIARGEKSAEGTISFMVIVLSAIMGLNAPAILAVGASFAKPLSKKYGISPYRTANLLDAQSNTLAYCLPWTPAMVYTLGFAADSTAPLTAAAIIPCCFYCFAMLVVMTARVRWAASA